MQGSKASWSWGKEEFGSAKLGNSLRTQRLAAIAAAVADRPGGKITEVFSESADREGAYRLVESEHSDPGEILKASMRATIQRCVGEEYVFVPLDGTSLSLPDPNRVRGMGSVGPYKRQGQGVEVMNGIAVHRDGTPLGLMDQVYWVREKQPGRKKTRMKRKLGDKETRYWLEAAKHVLEAMKEHGEGVVPWFQLDRGGDFRDALLWASSTEAWVTVRAAQNRRVKDPEARYLWEQMEKTVPLGCYEVEVPARAKRERRRARMQVRARPVTLILQNRWLKTKPKEVTLTAVLVLEKGTVPDGEKPLQWLLLTNRNVTNFEEAAEVLFGYTQRWRVEDFHKTWKSVCRVEETQLRSVQAIEIWAIILAAVAMRIERLKHLARETPDVPATVELSLLEIDAIIVLKKPKGCRRGAIPNIGDAVRWIAELGGYTGRSSGGLPGSTTLGRGLKRLEPVVIALQNLKDMGPPGGN